MIKELNFFNVIPIWGLFLMTATVVLISLEAGYRLGRYRSALAEHEKEGSTGTMVGATLGLLAFLLAFTFNMASSRYDARRQAFLGEVNAIGNAYLRADLLQEPYRSKTRDLFRKYVDLRLEKLDPKDIAEMLRESKDLQRLLWSVAIEAKAAPFYLQSLNEVFDSQTRRVTAALRSYVPGTIWAVLYAITMLAMAAMGYHVGLTGSIRPLAIPFLALVFAAVIQLIADLDRPFAGMITVDQRAMVELRHSMDIIDAGHASVPSAKHSAR
jgi:hypothetical protein